MNIKIWLPISILILVIAYIGFNKYNSTMVDNGRLSGDNVTLSDSIDYKNWSAAITDQVVSEFVKDKITTITLTEHVRKEAIDEYLKESKAVVYSCPGVAPVTNVDNSRIIKLAGRMLDYYCTAAENDPRCNPPGTVN